MLWPNNHSFAFTIVDDTDFSCLQNIKPVYDYLLKNNIRSTKTVWVLPSKDKFKGQTILDNDYLDFIKSLKNKGFEIQMHNVGSGCFKRDDIINGLEIFKELLHDYPSLHVNHAQNPDNIYWGYKRFGKILRNVMKFTQGRKSKFYGDDPDSEYFWGDHARKHIKYIRNRVFYDINTLKQDPRMPYKEKNKEFSNYWFSSSDGHTVEEFNNLLSKKNVDKLDFENGLCIVYTHFACGFVSSNGELNANFKSNIEYLTSKNGWFATASEILDYLIINSKESITETYLNVIDIKWLLSRIKKKMKFKR